MAEITLELDDALLGAAAHALGTRGAPDTIRAALAAAARVGGPVPRTPGSVPGPGPGLPPLGDPPRDPPEMPARTAFPRPPEIR